MPRYFFSLYDHARDTDEDGTELPDQATAQREAIRYIGSVLHDEPDLLTPDTPLLVVVEDEARRRVFAIRITAADD